MEDEAMKQYLTIMTNKNGNNAVDTITHLKDWLYYQYENYTRKCVTIEQLFYLWWFVTVHCDIDNIEDVYTLLDKGKIKQADIDEFNKNIGIELL